MVTRTLIKNAELFGENGLADVRIEGDKIQQIAASLPSVPDEQRIDAAGGILLPGLHDHHIHLLAFAASLESISCGPPDVESEESLASLLREKNRENEHGWIRGIGYHPSVAGDIDRDWLDQHIADRPIRIQHRGGRLWILNTMALEALGVSPGNAPPGLEILKGRLTGRLLEGDRWLRERMHARPPDLTIASRLLARYGITGITDTTPSNGASEWKYFAEAQAKGELLQRVRVMGSPQVQHCEENDFLRRGELKIHLLESRLPDFDSVARAIQNAHFSGRCVAVHCVTLTELVFALGALRDAGVLQGDRIEHASVCPPEQLQEIQRLGLRVITQPHFIEERGDQYLAEVEKDDQPWLYRAAAFLAEDIPLAAGSDAPFGLADPWHAMAASVSRKTVSGKVMGKQEALTPEQALQLFLSPPERAGESAVKLAAGSPADLCLLQAPWRLAREHLHHELVCATWRAGQLIYCLR